MNMPTVQSDNTLSFPHGLIGYEQHNQFQLFSPESDNPTVYELQSLTDQTLALSVVSPEALKLQFSITLTDEESELLELSDPHDAVIALIVYKPIEDDEPQAMKAIVKAPIIINSKSKLAIQKQLSALDTIN
ncbi:MAG: flagellar assembly protein FliW [Gammaproteobacteria bacterium]|nr:flagellar assembly protein FliW [Gammaproteobacteria bacterium]